MTRNGIQPVEPRVSERLRKRLATLGVTVVRVGHDGALAAQGPAGELEQMLLRSPSLRASVQAHSAGLRGVEARPVEIWPGVWLAPLADTRRRRSSGDAEPLVVVLMITPELLDSDHFRLLCDQAQLDWDLTRRRVDRTRLYGPSEVQRAAQSIMWMQQDVGEMDRRLRELQSMSQQLAESYEELSLLYKLSSGMTVNRTPTRFLAEACEEIQQVVGLRWMALHLAQNSQLGDMAGRSFAAGLPDADRDAAARIGEQLLCRPDAGDRPLVIERVDDLGIEGLPALARHLLVVWLSREGEPFGVLFGADKIDGSQISTVDSKLCSSLASSMSIFIQNAMLFEDMQAMFMGTLHALTSAIDAKDAYTLGHSERVALASRQLAEAAGLESALVERVYIAGLIHDVGKIGVPEAVLCKPGKLTAAEYDQIKLHPEIGARILQDIRQMRDLIPGVIAHHERWDGRGYPYGIAGEAIPLFGRLIGLADAFDAMSTSRTYRRALRHDQVLDEIRRCSGTQFDPHLAELFLKLDFAEFFDMVARHQTRSGQPIPTGDDRHEAAV